MRLERKLAALREGQLAFAGAVTELNSAAARAEAALSALRSSGQDADLLHDRILKGRALKAELEGLLARGPRPAAQAAPEPVAVAAPEPAPRRVEPVETVPQPVKKQLAGLLDALAANQAAKQSLNRARRSLDADLFAA
jgi:hypothetical protein